MPCAGPCIFGGNMKPLGLSLTLVFLCSSQGVSAQANPPAPPLATSMAPPAPVAPSASGAAPSAPWAVSATPPPAPEATGAMAVMPPGLAAMTLAGSRAERLGGLLGYHVEHARSRRRAVTAVALSAAGAGIFAGGYRLATAGDIESSAGGGMMLGVGIGALLGAGLAQIISTPLEDMGEHFLAARAQVGDAAAVAALEADWDARVERQRAQRRIAAGTVLGLGALFAGIGAFVANSDTGASSRDREAASLGGASLFMVGTALAITGTALLYQHDELESSWELWRRVR